MSREVVRRPPGALVTFVDDARSTATVGFDGEVLTWASLPADSQRAAKHKGRVLAEQVGTDARVHEAGSEVVQVMRGWRAHRDALFVVVAARPVMPGRDDLTPVGPWRHLSARRFDVVGEPRRRVGWVPAGVVPDESATGGPRRSATTPRHTAQEAGAASAWPHLPAPVRQGLGRAVPVPDDWLGEIVQRDCGARPVLSQSITMLRRDDERAVVVVATRERPTTPGLRAADEEAALAQADWMVEQLTFELRAEQHLDAARPVARLPWA